MKHSFLPIFSAILLAADPAPRAANPAPIPAPAGEFDFAADQKRHEAEVDKIEFDSEVALEALLAHYLSRLELLRQGAQREGDLLGVMAVEQEVARIKANRTPVIPAGGPPAGLPALARSFSESWARQEKNRETLREASITRRREALEARIKSLTQAGKLEEAGVIWKALEELKKPPAPPVTSFRPPAPSPAPAPEPGQGDWLSALGVAVDGSSEGSGYDRLAPSDFHLEAKNGSIRLHIHEPTRYSRYKLYLGKRALKVGDEWELEVSGAMNFQVADVGSPGHSMYIGSGDPKKKVVLRARYTPEGIVFERDGETKKATLARGMNNSSLPAFLRSDLRVCLAVEADTTLKVYRVTQKP